MNKTPRQKQGQGFVPMTVLVRPHTRDAVKARAKARERPESFILREIVERAVASWDEEPPPSLSCAE